MTILPALLFSALLATAAPCAAQNDPAAALEFETGTVTVGDGLATLDLPEGWSYLRDADARFVVEEVWGNPEDESVIGFASPPGDLTWGVIFSTVEDGHVLDEDAAGLDYDELLEEMQSDTREANSYRVEAGFEPVELLGWAEPPHYDSAAKKLYWAKELRFGEDEETTLNYDVRILGRKGVLVMSAVASTSQLEEVAEGAKRLLEGTRFNEGHRYEDYDSSIDELAAYGVGGLIAGKVLTKVGLFKYLGLFLAKGWKLVLVGFAVLGSAVARLRKRS